MEEKNKIGSRKDTNDNNPNPVRWDWAFPVYNSVDTPCYDFLGEQNGKNYNFLDNYGEILTKGVNERLHMEYFERKKLNLKEIYELIDGSAYNIFNNCNLEEIIKSILVEQYKAKKRLAPHIIKLGEKYWDLLDDEHPLIKHREIMFLLLANKLNHISVNQIYEIFNALKEYDEHKNDQLLTHG